MVKDSLRLTFGCSQYEVSLMSPVGALVCRVFVQRTAQFFTGKHGATL